MLREQSETGTYVTYIYEYNGSLCEFYGAEDDMFSPADGEALVKSSGIDFAEQDGILTISAVQSNGQNVQICIRLRQNEE